MLYIFQNFAWTTFLRFYVLYIFLLIKTHALCFLQTWRKTWARLYLRISVMQSFFRPRGGGKWVPLCSYITLIGHVILPICRAVSSLVVSVKKGKVCKKGAVLAKVKNVISTLICKRMSVFLQLYCIPYSSLPTVSRIT